MGGPREPDFVSGGSTPEREERLWLRAALWLGVAPGLLIILVYVAAPWVVPLLSEKARVDAALGIGLGASMCFTGIFGLGALRLSEGLERGSRVTVQSILVAWISIGASAVLLTFARPGSLLGWAGWVLLLGGISMRVAAHLAPIFRRFGHRRHTPPAG